jgi:protein SCO1
MSCSAERAPQFNSVDITGADYGSTLALPDANGALRSLKEFEGKVVAVFFGYTHCPDVCPTSLALLADVIQRLGADGERVQTIFVSVDPERDTPAQLGAYVKAFHPSFIGLAGSLEQTAQAAKAFKVFYQKVDDKGDGRYNVDHTAGIYLFDAQGRIRLFVRHGETPERLMADIKILLDQSSSAKK